MRLIFDNLECLSLVILLVLPRLHLYGVLLDLIESKHRTYTAGIFKQVLPAILWVIEGVLIKDFIIFDIFLVGATPRIMRRLPPALAAAFPSAFRLKRILLGDIGRRIDNESLLDR